MGRAAGGGWLFPGAAGLVVWLAIGALAGAQAARTGAPGRDPRAASAAGWVEDFAHGAAGWGLEGALRPGGHTREPIEQAPSVVLRPGGWMTHALPAGGVAVSLDVLLRPRTSLEVAVRPGGGWVLSRSGGAAVSVSGFGAHARLRGRPWRSGGWRHLELVTGAGAGLALDGRRVAGGPPGGATLALRSRRGALDVAAVVASARSAPSGLLLERLTEVHAHLRARSFPVAQTAGGRLVLGRGWTIGFWPGALWQASELAPTTSLFSGWALPATLSVMGHEREDTHDLGFIYGTSAQAAYDRLCAGPGGGGRPAACGRLRSSALTAARSLVGLAGTNAAAGMLPTRARGCAQGCRGPGQADTIVDSMMNLPILLWARDQTGDPRFAQVASRSARRVAQLLVRPDGSTIQSVHVGRADGRVVLKHTHQGISASSTWARGQGWAVYGFAQTATALRDPGLLQVAERTAQYVAGHLPASGVPRWDYAAGPGAPVDVSAGAITAAGLFALARGCAALPGTCAQGERWAPLGRRMLAAALGRARTAAPIGYLGDEVYDLHSHTAWKRRAELVFGLHYALDALNRQSAAGP